MTVRVALPPPLTPPLKGEGDLECSGFPCLEDERDICAATGREINRTSVLSCRHRIPLPLEGRG